MLQLIRDWFDSSPRKVRLIPMPAGMLKPQGNGDGVRKRLAYRVPYDGEIIVRYEGIDDSPTIVVKIRPEEVWVKRFDGQLLLCGYCQTTKTQRWFRLDRITAAAFDDGIPQQPLGEFWRKIGVLTDETPTYYDKRPG